jgi:hypothetical protein
VLAGERPPDQVDIGQIEMLEDGLPRGDLRRPCGCRRRVTEISERLGITEGGAFMVCTRSTRFQLDEVAAMEARPRTTAGATVGSTSS